MADFKAAAVAVGTINKATAAALAAPITDWLAQLAADHLVTCCTIAMPVAVEMSLSSILLGLVVWLVPNASTGNPSAG